MKDKTKKIIGFSLLFVCLVIIKLFLGGTYLYNFWKELIPEIITLLLVCLVLMIIPYISKAKNKNKLEYNKGRKICMLNSLLLFIIFSVPQVINIGKKYGTDYAAYSVDTIEFSLSLILIYFIFGIIFYFINMCFFVESKSKQKKD